jgi:hypothetical protein
LENESSFFLCFVRTRKKLDKYFKNNKIRNKQIIDIKKILEEEKISLNDREAVSFFKVLVWNRIKIAQEKGKDIYYIPNFTSSNLEIDKLLNFKNTLLNDNNNFNLLLFFDEFIGTNWLLDVLDELDTFDGSQILKDY